MTSTIDRSRVLLLGGGGFIGHSIVALLTSETPRPEITVADLSVPILPAEATVLHEHIATLRRRKISEDSNIVSLDVRDRSSVVNVIQDFRPNAIVHLAAVSVAEHAERDPARCWDINVGGLRNVLDAIRGWSGRLVFVSSSFVYGDFRSPSVDENHPLRAHGVYGRSKLRGEELVREEVRQSGLEAVIVRPSAVYGPFDSNARVVQRLVEQAHLGQPSSIRGPETTLDFTFVDDVAEGIAKALIHPMTAGQAFNITAGKGRTLAELAAIIRRYYPNHETRLEPADSSKPRRGTLDIELASRILGYSPKWSLESGVEAYVNFYRSLQPGG